MMETRTRGRRRNNPVPEIEGSPQQQTSPRTTRRTATSTVKDTVAVAGYGSLSRDPIPRRGAHQLNDAASIASLSSRVQSRSEIAEDDDEEELESSQSQHADGPLPEDSASPDDEEQYQIMKSLLPDFTRATDELQHRLVNGDYGNRVFAAILKSKRTTFHSLVDNYLKSGSDSLFIDLDWVEELGEGTESVARVLGPLSRANTVTALDCIQYIKNNDVEDIASILGSLDSAFMHAFTSENSTEEHWMLALDLRTCYLVEALAAQGPHPDVEQTVASVFCKDPNSNDYASLLANGPFKSLTRKNETETSDDEDELISKRTTELYTFAFNDKKDHGLGQMRAAYPLDRALNKLSQFLAQWYINSKDAERNERAGLNGQPETGRESWHDAEETIPDSVSESQSIIMRPTEGERKRASLFQGARSLRDLQAESNPNQAVPPSNQQQHNKAPSPAPFDYSQDETRDLLRNDTIRSSGRAQKRERNSDDDDDDEESDEFEDDAREVPESRVSHIKARSAAQAAKRQRLPPEPPSRSMPPPPRPTSSLPPSTDEPDYETIKRLKSEAIARARSRALDSSQHISSSTPSSSTTTTTHVIASPPKQRYVWSNKDCNLLLKLIKERHAAWSAIEREHNHEFEHPRNQQAYRDKARNMKVDFLIMDAVLPSGFDLVTLGKKEIARLLSLGKNPYRREDEKNNERALNTNV